MAQRADTSDQPAIDRAPLGRWGTLHLVEPAQAVGPGATIRWPGEGPRLLGEPGEPGEPGDPGIVWVAGLPDERSSADLTMRDLLSTWRSAERRLDGMPDGDRESFLIRAQIVALRVAYQRLFAQIRRGLPAG